MLRAPCRWLCCSIAMVEITAFIQAVARRSMERSKRSERRERERLVTVCSVAAGGGRHSQPADYFEKQKAGSRCRYRVRPQPDQLTILCFAFVRR